MIKSIRATDIYTLISTLGIPNCEVFSLKPNEQATPTSSYLYMSIVSDNPQIITLDNVYSKIARVQFNIFAREDLTGTDEETVLIDIVEFLDLYLSKEFCNKVFTINLIEIMDIFTAEKTPIFYNEKNRPYIIKDFLFHYKAK